MKREAETRVPKLRFPEFEGSVDWRRDQIGNIASISKGKSISKADTEGGGAVPCIRYAELYTHYGEVIHDVVSSTNVPQENLVLSQTGDVIIPASGETKADIAKAACVLDQGVALGSDLNVLRSDLYGPFFSYLLNSPLRHEIARVAQGDTVAHLYPKQLSQVGLTYPSLLEQQKIADCLGSLDDLIAAEGRKLEALRQHKKGLMQQLFPQPWETVPKLRFPEFMGQPLHHVRLRDLTEQSTARNGKKPPLGTVMGVKKEDGIVPMEERLVASDISRYKLVRNNWFAYNPMRLNIGSIARWQGDGDILVSPDYVVFRCLERSMPTALIPDYLDSFCSSWQWGAFVNEAGDGGVRVRIYYRDIAQLQLTLPDVEEQQKIADCISSLDDLIATEDRKLEALRQHKKGLMQQLFPGPKESHA